MVVEGARVGMGTGGDAWRRWPFRVQSCRPDEGCWA